MSFIYEQYEQYEQIVKNKGNYSVHMSVHTVHTSGPFAPGAAIIGYLPTSPQFHANGRARLEGIARSVPHVGIAFWEVREGSGSPFLGTQSLVARGRFVARTMRLETSDPLRVSEKGPKIRAICKLPRPRIFFANVERLRL